MRQYEISRLMDEYTDTEFFPTGGSVADPAAVRSQVLAAVPGGKRRTPPKKRTFLVVLAAVMVILMGAGIGLPTVVYQLANGPLHFEQTANHRSVAFHYEAPLMELEEGRLYFVLDGQRTDITDQISDDTPYIYDGSDPETGLTYYVILGGTPEGYGWLEWVVMPSLLTPGEDGMAVDGPDQDGMISAYAYQWTIPAQDGQDEGYHSGGVGMDAVHWDVMMDRPWLLAGARQLQIPLVDPRSGTDDIFYVS